MEKADICNMQSYWSTKTQGHSAATVYATRQPQVYRTIIQLSNINLMSCYVHKYQPCEYLPLIVTNIALPWSQISLLFTIITLVCLSLYALVAVFWQSPWVILLGCLLSM